MSQLLNKKQQYLIILIASLGYFVDIYDLILFNVVKRASLLSIGIAETDLPDVEIFLFNCQMGGMLLGGLLWGILGDKRGRVRVLFGSILLYSIANIANAWAWNVPSYAIIRLIAGIGLAGELGAGITLISEVMQKEKRGYGTMIVVTFGALGAVFAGLIGVSFDWKTSYYIGGAMGLLLLLMRVGVLESGMFKGMHESTVKRGDFLSLFSSGKRFRKYLACIALGLPVWFVVGVLIALSESYFEKQLGLTGDIKTSYAVMYCYIGLSAGDLLAGLLSQVFKSRIRVVTAYLIFSLLMTFVFLFTMHGQSATYFYLICTILGAATGYWGLFVTVASEQFGTNIRSTVTSTVPNFVRGAVIPITFSFKQLASIPSIGTTYSALIVGSVCVALSLISAAALKDTFGKDLDYLES